MSEPVEIGPASGNDTLDQAWTHLWELSEPAARGWLSSTRPVTLHESLLIIAVPDEFTRDQVEKRLRRTLEAQLTEHLGRPIQLAITIDPSTTGFIPPETPSTSRYPSLFTPVATMTATFTTRPPSRTFMVRASAATNVYGPWSSGRLRKSATSWSSSPAITDT